MRGLLTQHATLASFVILFLEDLGIPMPLPADVIIMYAGYRARQHEIHPVLIFLLMLLAVCSASTILYSVVRAGGRPLVDRYGRYLHLDQAKLDRAEGWVRRRGVLGIVVSRAIPGVRLATVISCGVFRVPLATFLPAQIAGTLIYMVVFFSIGYFLGPAAIDHLRLPAHTVRLLLMTAVALALPLGLRRINRSTLADDTRAIQERLLPRQRDSAALLAGFAGTVELSLIWAIFSSLIHLTNQEAIRHAATTILRLFATEDAPHAMVIAYGLDYVVALLLCLFISLIYFRFLMPRLHVSLQQLGGQILFLWLFSLAAFVAAVIVQVLHHLTHPEIESLWLTSSAGMVIGILALCLLGYSYVAAEMRRLAIDRFADVGRPPPSPPAK